MNTIDIIVGLLLLLSVVSGWREGFVRQVLSLAGLVAAIWLASRYGDQAGSWLHVEESAAPAAGFIVVLLAVGLAAALAAWGVSKLFHFAGFGIPDRLLGAVVSVLKCLLLLSVLFRALNYLDRDHSLVGRERIETSKTYKPILGISEKVLPCLRWVGEQVPQRDEE